MNIKRTPTQPTCRHRHSLSPDARPSDIIRGPVHTRAIGVNTYTDIRGGCGTAERTWREPTDWGGDRGRRGGLEMEEEEKGREGGVGVAGVQGLTSPRNRRILLGRRKEAPGLKFRFSSAPRRFWRSRRKT